MTLRTVVVAAVLGVAAYGCGDPGEKKDPLCADVAGECTSFPSGTSEQDIQNAILAAKTGQTFSFGEGTFSFENSITLDSIEGLTFRGAGREKTVLDFAGQKAGSEGIAANRTHKITVEALTVKDTKGDGIKIEGAEGVTFRHVKVLWTGENATAHGAYGLYPVQCKKVLIEDSFVSGASDAGIYVGQSEQIVVRRNEATENVAGIEIENSINADVYENYTHGNTGGLLVFGLPGLQIPNGHHCRVYNNRIITNTHRNFAEEGNTVAIVPAGTGLLVMATSNVEVFGNTIVGSKTASIAVISYLLTGRVPTDTNYNPFTSNVYVHDNTITNNGDAPDISRDLGFAMWGIKTALPNYRLPDFTVDGIVNPLAGSGTNPMKICIGSSTSLLDLNATVRDPSTGAFAAIKLDPTPYQCTLPALPAVSFEGL